jgi:hypothetical protein
MCEPEERPNLRTSVNNILQPMPLPTKLKLLLLNNLLKVRTLSSCCGHSGQPGC